MSVALQIQQRVQRVCALQFGTVIDM